MQEQIVNKIKDYIGSPEGLGKAKKSPPALGTSLVRRVLWRDGNLTEKKTTLEGYIGSGLSSVVYKGGCEGTEIVEKFTADIPPGNNKKSYAKKFMEGVFVLFRQAPFSYRTNFFAAMTNHYAHFVIEVAS